MFASHVKPRVTFDVVGNSKRCMAYCRVRFSTASEPEQVHCVLDTGSSRIVIPQRHWRRHIPSPVKLPETTVRGVSGRLPAYLGTYPITIVGLADPEIETPGPYYIGLRYVYLACDEDAVDAAIKAAEKNKKELTRKDACKDYQLPYGLLGREAFDKGGVCINWKQDPPSAHFMEVH